MLLPEQILIAYSGAKVFGANPYLGAVIGMIMIHPNLQNAWTVATEGVQTTQKVWFGLYSIDMIGYQGHVIPVIIAVWVLAQIEKRLHKVVPAMFDLFVTPLAVALKTKDQKIKSMAVPSALSACMGITEPAIFGVNLRFGKPFVMGCVGGAVGALFASVTGLGATGTGVTGIFGILLCLNNPVSYILMFIIAFGAAFVLTWVFGYKDAAAENKTLKSESIEETHNIENKEIVTEETVKYPENDNNVLYSVLEGNAIRFSQVDDATFASEVLGKGIAVIPSKGEVVAPCDATVETVFDTKHAVGLSTEDGMELLIHIGINTVELNGKYYTSHVKNGDRVKKGQPLISFDICKIKDAGYDITTPLIVTNSDDYKDVKILLEGTVTPADKVLEIVK